MPIILKLGVSSWEVVTSQVLYGSLKNKDIYVLRHSGIRGVSRNALYKCTILTYLLSYSESRTLQWINGSTLQVVGRVWASDVNKNKFLRPRPKPK